MGAFLEKPKTEKHNLSGEAGAFKYALSSMQGWRIEMEDAHTIQPALPGNLSNWSFFAVFDGHAGDRISDECSKQLLNTIIESESFKAIDENTPNSVIEQAIVDGFLKLDRQLEQQFKKEYIDEKSGSTAVCVFVTPTQFIFVNCGDSRAMLVRTSSAAPTTVTFATEDHKPENFTEKNRIQTAGGKVVLQRVNGSLAVSRALGDYDYKRVVYKPQTQQLVSPEPEITFIERNPQEDCFLVLACDGVWDVMSNEDLAKQVAYQMSVSGDLARLCNIVLDTCLRKGSRDNMSIIAVACEAAPAVDEAKAKQDAEIDEEFRKLIAREKKCDDTVKFNYLLNTFPTSILSDVPEGIYSKFDRFSTIYSEETGQLVDFDLVGPLDFISSMDFNEVATTEIN